MQVPPSPQDDFTVCDRVACATTFSANGNRSCRSRRLAWLCSCSLFLFVSPCLVYTPAKGRNSIISCG